MSKVNISILSIILLLMGSCNSSSNINDLSVRLDSIMDKHYQQSSPGAAILIAKNGEIIYERYIGVANMETNSPITENTAFNIASISKQFTAVSALKLQEEGKINLNDSVKKYFPHFKSCIWDKVKLKHLLSHSSGVPDARPRTDREFMLHATDEQSVCYMEELDTLKFEPGSAYDYINPTFDLFYFIIEQVSGLKFEEFQKLRIFDAANMKNVQYFAANKTIPHMAHGYIVNEDAQSSGTDSDYEKKREKSNIDYVDSNNVHWAECDYGEETFFATKADGGIYTTARDFLNWEIALKNNSIISQESLDMAYNQITKVSGSQYCNYQNRENTFYGLGWFIDKTFASDTKVYHTGDNGGFQAYACKYLNNNVNVIMFENRNDIDRWSTQLKIEQILKEHKILE